MVLKEEIKSCFKNIPFYPVPMIKVKPWFLPLVMQYYAVKDKLNNRKNLF